MNPDTFPHVAGWPYLYTLTRLLLALGLGLFIGLERERRGKGAGVRTFAFVAGIGCAGGFLGDAFSLASLFLIVPFIVFLNLHSLKKDDEVEMTTSAALLVVGFVGVLCGKGHTFTPVTLGLVTAALLAWKQPLAGFSVGITESELRSAILLGILACVVYPVMPTRFVDPWHLIEPRTVWVTVILIAAIGFGNYILLKAFGSRGVGISGFLAGLVNSTVAVTELSSRARTDSKLSAAAYRGTMLATSAMLLRNTALLAILAPQCLVTASLPLFLMFVGSAVFSFIPLGGGGKEDTSSPRIELDSPFSLIQALKFGLVFLVLSIFGTLAQRLAGSAGFYFVSAAGGLVSSASAVASAGQLSAHHELLANAGGVGAAIASITSALVGIPLVARIAGNRQLTKRTSIGITAVAIVGILSTVAAYEMAPWFNAHLHLAAQSSKLGVVPGPKLDSMPSK